MKPACPVPIVTRLSRIAAAALLACALPAAAQTAPPAPSTQPPGANAPATALTLTAPNPFTGVGTSLGLVWTAPSAPARLRIEYSANDGRTWQAWQEIETGGKSRGTVSLPVGWPQFNWWFFSWEKVTLMLQNDKHWLDRQVGHPVRVRLSAPGDPAVPPMVLRGVNVAGPVWYMPLAVGTLLAWVMMMQWKTRWQKEVRTDLSLVFNAACFGCLFAKVTFMLAFMSYLVVGFAIYHRITIIQKNRTSLMWLTTIYQWGTIGLLGIFALLIVGGLVLRVRDWIF